MNIELTQHEIRVIGCLIEKEITTPEQYPLSLNALTNACNQRSNRDPVMNLDDVQVQQVVDDLIRKFQVNEQAGFGSRVPKFQHRFCNSNYGALKFSAQELGILCELFLRGPQTPGELRSNARRLCPFGEVGEVEAVLTRLAGREDGPFVRRLPREPGKRESRYTHLFGAATNADAGAGDTSAAEDAASATVAGAEAVAGDRLIKLEQRVEALEAELAALRQLVEELTAP